MHRQIATLFGIGWLRPAPGTWASAATVAAGYALHRIGHFPLVALATLVVEQAWARLDEDVWQADDLATGERQRVRLAGGVVLAAPGVELQDLTLT